MTASLHILADRVQVRVIAAACYIAGRKRCFGDVAIVWPDEAQLLLADGAVAIVLPPAPVRSK